MTRKITLSMAASLLLLTSAPAFAQEQGTVPTRQNQGLVGAIGGGSEQQAPSVAPTVDPLPIVTDQAPSTNQAPASNQAAPAPILDAADLKPLPAIAPTNQLPALGDVGPASNQLPALGQEASIKHPEAVLSESPAALPPAQAFPQQEAAAEKKPGFFKRMWTKIKSVFTKKKTQPTEEIAVGAQQARG
ncbi:MAG: hypothetical protein KIT58_03640 [Planctomycetota bacterium]|nr:hypothetical protein [Planctomycetota bacterium]